MNEFRFLRRRRRHEVLGIAAVSIAFACAAPCAAQGSAAPGAGSGSAASASAPPYSAAVNANNVFVRSSPSVNSSYPFAKLANGDIVEVLDENYGWARVR